ncbi:hypothetical protein CP980_31800 [Streptomyces vinaceus]|uniref:Chaplin n=1 Tax=Streptomyces vinaceus TaxID=1960 RepID=A0A5J6JGD1_STRVI|nr:hypothetical protein [Streptomyces vinaceus]QEV49053.1 hypothetical protein CP980_31800 [Streptomyces vinaceus]GHE72733.1 hypothetical protein GCM10017778_67390 [Streptomyces vinaceus]
MKKIIASGLMAAAALAGATPAFADNDSNFGGGVNAANNWNFTAAAVCLQEVAVVPVMGDWVGDHANNCSNGNVIDHSGGASEDQTAR